MSHPDRKVAAILEAHGFRIVRLSKGHYFCHGPGGAMTVVAYKRSPERRLYKNIETSCRRALREKGIACN